MAQYVDFVLTFTDTSTGLAEEDGTEVQIYTDSPSYAPTIPVDYQPAHHSWMALPLIKKGVTSIPIKLEAPLTFVRARVRQFNANGSGEWNFPGGAAGTLFLFSSEVAANAPTAPTNVGLVVVGTATPPVEPPVDPPPTPDPGGGGGASSNYVFTSQFSGVQGQNQWSYRDAAGNLLSYSSSNGLWTGAQDYQSLWNGGIHPGTTIGTVLRWTAPAGGVALVTGSVALGSNSGFGVTWTIKHGASTIEGPTSLTNTTPVNISETVTMLANEYLDFIVTGISGNSYTSTALTPSIQFTTDGSTPANPILSTLVPSSGGVSVGGSTNLTVSLTSAPSSAVSVAVTSSDVSKATVPATITIAAGQTSGSITVTGVAAGSSTVTATYNSTSLQSTITVVAPASSTWANAPVGGTVLVDTSCATISPFIDFYNSTTFHSDSSAPISPPTVMRHRIEATASTGGGETTYTSPTKYREFYVGMTWRTNPPYLGRPVGNKLFFMRGGPGSNAFFLLTGRSSLQVTSTGGQLVWSTNGGFQNSHTLGGDGILGYPNVNNPVIIPGVWYKFECYIKASTTQTSQDGVVKWWVNDLLTGSYSNVNYCATDNTALDTFVWNETWDGSGDLQTARTEPWEYYLDHVRIVGKN